MQKPDGYPQAFVFRNSIEKMMVTTVSKQRDNECGSALVYILIAIALLSALTISLMEPASQQATAQNTVNLATQLRSQINYISAAIQECVLTYPNQADDITSTNQKNAPYPINPKDPYFNTATPGVAATTKVENIRCPGNPGGSDVNKKNHAMIFGATSGKFMPQPPSYLPDGWYYYNGADGVYIGIPTNKVDPFIDTAMQRVNDQFSTCEVDIIDATAGAVAMSSDIIPGNVAVASCSAGYRCLRYWIILNTATSVHGDGAGC